MDTVTQALLGAAVGYAVAGRRFGRRALGWGALGGVLPDLDLLAALSGPWAELLHHRGFTHSLWFGPALGLLAGWLFARRRRRAGAADPSGEGRALGGLVALSVGTHPLLDLFTTYGTQLLAPFHRHRFALDGVAIIDPFYSVPLLVGVLVAIIRPRGRSAPAAVLAALALTTAYLGLGVWLNHRAEVLATRQLEAQGLVVEEVHAYPTLLQPVLRRVVARAGERTWVGYLTLLEPEATSWRSFLVAEPDPVRALRATDRGRLFEWFAMGRTHGEALPLPDGGALVRIHDLRYGVLDGPPGHGLWGIAARVDAEGRLVGEVSRFRSERMARPGPALADLIRAALRGFVPRAHTSQGRAREPERRIGCGLPHRSFALSSRLTGVAQAAPVLDSPAFGLGLGHGLGLEAARLFGRSPCHREEAAARET